MHWVLFVCLFFNKHLYIGAWSYSTRAASRIVHTSLTVTLEVSCVLPAILLQTISRSNEQLVKYAWKSCIGVKRDEMGIPHGDSQG